MSSWILGFWGPGLCFNLRSVRSVNKRLPARQAGAGSAAAERGRRRRMAGNRRQRPRGSAEGVLDRTDRGVAGPSPTASEALPLADVATLTLRFCLRPA
jgi:hypothetical protein